MTQRILTDDEQMKLALDAMSLRSNNLRAGTVMGYDDETFCYIFTPKLIFDHRDYLLKVFIVIRDKVT